MWNESDRYKTKLLPRKSWDYVEVVNVKEQEPFPNSWVVSFVCCIIVGSILLFTK